MRQLSCDNWNDAVFSGAALRLAKIDLPVLTHLHVDMHILTLPKSDLPVLRSLKMKCDSPFALALVILGCPALRELDIRHADSSYGLADFVKNPVVPRLRTAVVDCYRLESYRLKASIAP